MPKDLAKYHGDPEDPEQKSYSQVRERMQSDLQWLIRQATRGERSAIQLLAEQGADAARILAALLDMRPEPIIRAARTASEWPMVLGPSSKYPHDESALRKKLQLGQNLAVRNDKVLHKRKPLVQRQIVACALSGFLSFRNSANSLRRAHGLKQILGMLPTGGTLEHAGEESTLSAAALHKALLEGELSKAEEAIKDAFRATKRQRHELRRLLQIPPSQPDVATPVISEVLTATLQLPEISHSTADQWFPLLARFLMGLIENKLEENEVLRRLGESRGDVEVRNLCENETPAEFKKKKIELRQNATVNDAIRRRILERLLDAYTRVVAEGEGLT